MRPASITAALIVLLLSTAGPAAAAVENVPRMERVAACSWDSPGHNPFMGDVVAAIDRYSDIPTLVRIKLKQRMQARRYDDLVDIRRDTITGRERYEPTIRDMHFGLDRVCRQVTRARWTAAMHERGLVYCEQGYCILVPTVCRNVSRVDRRPTLVAGERMTAPSSAEPMHSAPSAGSGVAQTPAAEAGREVSSPPPMPITSSFAEVVAGAAVPLWPNDDAGVGAGDGGSTAWPGWPGTTGGRVTVVNPGGSGGGGGGGGGATGVGGGGGGGGVIEQALRHYAQRTDSIEIFRNNESASA